MPDKDTTPPDHTDLSELREKLAAIEHERWADWQRWCNKGDILERWDRQIETPYDQLSEEEKDSDREQVDRYLPLITLYAKQYAQPPVVADEEIDEILGDYGIGNALCILCKHDIYNHYWNGTHDWDACRVIGCKCIGKEIAREPNTVYECPLETEWVVNSDAKAALLQREQRLVAEARKNMVAELRKWVEYNKHDLGELGEFIRTRYVYNELEAQLRHNTNTGKEG